MNSVMSLRGLYTFPAYVCSQCGESYFEASDVDKIQEALSALEEKSSGLLTVE